MTRASQPGPGERGQVERGQVERGPRSDEFPEGPADPGPLGGGDLWQTLLAVQVLDLEIAHIEHRKVSLPDRAQLREVEHDRATVSTRIEGASAQRDSLQERQRELQSQLDSVEARIRTIEGRLYGARGGAARDLQAMDEEVRHLRRRQSELEDAELEAMVEQEPLDEELSRLQAEDHQLKQAQRGLRNSVAAAEAELSADAASAKGRREAVATALPADLADHYEAIRAKLGGVGAARLAGNRCEGCHLELPAAEVDRIKHLPLDALVTCEHCGRILVRGAVSTSAG